MGKWLKTVLTGGILGFIGGLLLAPDKGEKTRDRLKDGLEKAKGIGLEMTEKGKKIVDGLIDEIKKEG